MAKEFPFKDATCFPGTEPRITARSFVPPENVSEGHTGQSVLRSQQGGPLQEGQLGHFQARDSQPVAWAEGALGGSGPRSELRWSPES